MGLLTIGAFARAARLTPKALRLYDEQGLLPPAAVDPESGYRYYHPDQLGRARLIARLRGIGMPLAEIRAVSRLEPGAAAGAVEAYWRQVTADTARRRRLATLLVDQLAEGSTSMSEKYHEPGVRYAARCDVGTVRESNEDAAYASEHLFAVADGMRGPGGDAASAAAIRALTTLETAGASAADLLTMAAAAVADADAKIRAEGRDRAGGRDPAEKPDRAGRPDPAGTAGQAGPDDAEEHRPATTLTAILCAGTQLALVHIGDTRAYLLRDGDLIPLTHDHTYVQALVDRGKLGPAEAAAHPQRALLTRALGGGGGPVEADLALRTAVPGDRYLLCSDGLHTVVGRDALRETLTGRTDPDQAVDRLIELAYAAGAPDNIACVIADITG